MKKYILYILLVPPLLFFLSACEETKTVSEGNFNFNREFPLEAPVENSLLTQWARKEVKDSLLIDDMEGKNNWRMTEGIATLEYTDERSIDGKHSLRYHTSMKDTAYIMLPENRTPWGSFGGQQGGGAHFGITFDEPQDWTAYNRISIWVYIHPSKTPIHHFFLDIVNEGTDYNTTTPRHDTVIQDLIPGQWHNVVWEISDLPRNRVKQFNIFQTLIGYEPGNDEFVTFDFDRLQLQKVDADHYDGWNIPNTQFAYSHIGYRPYDIKQALTDISKIDEFQLLNTQKEIVYTGIAKPINNKNGSFTLLDFTDFTTPGTYYLSYNSHESKPFPINEYVWLEPMFSGINFYFCQRCGYEVPGIHGICHQDWQGFYNNEKKVINGGWHDAGDMSQGYYRTAIGAYVLLRNLQQVKDKPELTGLATKLKDEALWGLKWIAKNRFSDGYHISWARQRIYSDNIIGTPDDVVIKAVNVPWENFLGAAVLTLAEQYYQDIDTNLLEEMRETALENWQQAYKSGKGWNKATYLEASWGAIASILLYQKTNDDKYKEAALCFGRLLTECQETTFQEGIPITGYFYTDSDRKTILQNNHGAFNEAPMLALRNLCQAFPDDQDWMKWYSSAVIYSDFFLKRGSKFSAPYYLLPTAVFRKSDMLAIEDENKRNFSLIQFNDGTALNDEYTLRTFPIWDSNLFHGGTSCHLSTSWALAEASRLRHDKSGMQLVGKQLEWTFGHNPFNQTLMYGVGYNFAPQFAYCTKNVVGSLAVGMDCIRGDKPHWNGSTYATCKEMWIAPVNRFMGTVAAFNENIDSLKQKHNIQISIEKEDMSASSQKAVIRLIGEGTHQLAMHLQNATTDFQPQKVALVKGEEKKIEVTFNIQDTNKPFVAAIIADADVQLINDVSGAYY